MLLTCYYTHIVLLLIITIALLSVNNYNDNEITLLT